MRRIPFVNIHRHSFRREKQTITVNNIYPGEGFAAFNGRNFYSVGLHPWHIKSHDENNEMLVMVEEALDFEHVLYIGEAGLDKVVKTDFVEQNRIFEAQAFMAEEFGKPLIIHCVRAYNEVLQLHKKMHPEMKWILHGYNGNVETTKQLERRGIVFSFGENLFSSDSKAVESFLYLTIDKIFLETDEYKGGVKDIYEKGAQLKNMPLEDLKKAIWDNFNKIKDSSYNVF